MPISTVLKKKLFRDFSYLNQRYVKKNYLKTYKAVSADFCLKNDIFEKELRFLFWGYDLEFWTLDFASKDFKYSKKKLSERIVFPLVNEGYIYKHFDKLTPSQTYEDHIFREELKLNYRVRYALTQKARLLVQRFYKQLEV